MRQARNVAHPFVGLDRLLSLVAVIAASGTAANGYLAQRGVGWQPLTCVTFIVLLIAAVIGISILGEVNTRQREFAARVYSIAHNTLQPSLTSDEASPAESLGLALGATMNAVQRLTTERDELRDRMSGIVEFVATGREANAIILATLTDDALKISSAATSIKAANDDLTTRLQAARDHAVSAACATDALAAGTTQLAGEIDAVTAHIKRGALIANTLADSVTTTQLGVDGIGRSALNVLKAADGISETLRAAERMALNASIEASRPGQAASEFKVVTGEIQSWAQTGSTALRLISEAVQELQVESEIALSGVREVKSALAAHIDVGRSLSNAIEQQSDAVRLILENLPTAEVNLRAMLNQAKTSARGEAQLDPALAGQLALERLPKHVEAIAKIWGGVQVNDPGEPESVRRAAT
jgi:methyl-accepting chemotaxis protein